MLNTLPSRYLFIFSVILMMFITSCLEDKPVINVSNGNNKSLNRGSNSTEKIIKPLQKDGSCPLGAVTKIYNAVKNQEEVMSNLYTFLQLHPILQGNSHILYKLYIPDFNGNLDAFGMSLITSLDINSYYKDTLVIKERVSHDCTERIFTRLLRELPLTRLEIVIMVHKFSGMLISINEV